MHRTPSHSRYLDKGLFSRTSFPLRGQDLDMGGLTRETDPLALEAAYAKTIRVGTLIFPLRLLCSLLLTSAHLDSSFAP
jgi:hypothetical protein